VVLPVAKKKPTKDGLGCLEYLAGLKHPYAML